MENTLIQQLQSFEQLKDVPVEQLEWLIATSDHRRLTEGEYLFRP